MDTQTLWNAYYDALKKEKWSRAIEILDDISERKPRDPQVHLKIGDTLQRMDRIREAVDAYHRAALYLIRDGFSHKAIGIYKIILRLDPNNKEAVIKLKKVADFLESEKMTPLKPPYSLPEPASEPAAGGEEIPEDKGAVQEIEPPEPSAAVPEMPPGPEQPPAEEPPRGRSLDVPQEPVHFDDLWTEEFKSVLAAEKEVKPTAMETWEDFDKFLAEVSGEMSFQPVTEEADADCPVCFLPLGKDTAMKIVHSAPSKTYMAGERIVEEGEYGDMLYFIRFGRVNLSAYLLGSEFVIATLFDGDLFGELTYLTGRSRTVSAIAVTDCDIVIFSQAIIMEAISRNPDVLECLNDLYQTHFADIIRKFSSD